MRQEALFDPIDMPPFFAHDRIFANKHAFNRKMRMIAFCDFENRSNTTKAIKATKSAYIRSNAVNRRR